MAQIMTHTHLFHTQSHITMKGLTVEQHTVDNVYTVIPNDALKSTHTIRSEDGH